MDHNRNRRQNRSEERRRPDGYNGRGSDRSGRRGPDSHHGRDMDRGMPMSRGPDIHMGRGPDMYIGRGDMHMGRGPDMHIGRGPDMYNGRGPDEYLIRGPEMPFNMVPEMHPGFILAPNFGRGPEMLDIGPEFIPMRAPDFGRGREFERHEISRGPFLSEMEFEPKRMRILSPMDQQVEEMMRAAEEEERRLAEMEHRLRQQTMAMANNQNTVVQNQVQPADTPEFWLPPGDAAADEVLEFAPDSPKKTKAEQKPPTLEPEDDTALGQIGSEWTVSGDDALEFGTDNVPKNPPEQKKMEQSQDLKTKLGQMGSDWTVSGDDALEFGADNVPRDPPEQKKIDHAQDLKTKEPLDGQSELQGGGNLPGSSLPPGGAAPAAPVLQQDQIPMTQEALLMRMAELQRQFNESALLMQKQNPQNQPNLMQPVMAGGLGMQQILPEQMGLNQNMMLQTQLQPSGLQGPNMLGVMQDGMRGPLPLGMGPDSMTMNLAMGMQQPNMGPDQMTMNLAMGMQQPNIQPNNLPLEQNIMQSNMMQLDPMQLMMQQQGQLAPNQLPLMNLAGMKEQEQFLLQQQQQLMMQQQALQQARGQINMEQLMFQQAGGGGMMQLKPDQPLLSQGPIAQTAGTAPLSGIPLAQMQDSLSVSAKSAVMPGVTNVQSPHIQQPIPNMSTQQGMQLQMLGAANVNPQASLQSIFQKSAVTMQDATQGLVDPSKQVLAGKALGSVDGSGRQSSPPSSQQGFQPSQFPISQTLQLNELSQSMKNPQQLSTALESMQQGKLQALQANAQTSNFQNMFPSSQGAQTGPGVPQPNVLQFSQQAPSQNPQTASQQGQSPFMQTIQLGQQNMSLQAQLQTLQGTSQQFQNLLGNLQQGQQPVQPQQQLNQLQSQQPTPSQVQTQQQTQNQSQFQGSSISPAALNPQTLQHPSQQTNLQQPQLQIPGSVQNLYQTPQLSTTSQQGQQSMGQSQPQYQGGSQQTSGQVQQPQYQGSQSSLPGQQGQAPSQQFQNPAHAYQQGQYQLAQGQFPSAQAQNQPTNQFQNQQSSYQPSEPRPQQSHPQSSQSSTQQSLQQTPQPTAQQSQFQNAQPQSHQGQQQGLINPQPTGQQGQYQSGQGPSQQNPFQNPPGQSGQFQNPMPPIQTGQYQTSQNMQSSNQHGPYQPPQSIPPQGQFQKTNAPQHGQYPSAPPIAQQGQYQNSQPAGSQGQYQNPQSSTPQAHSQNSQGTTLQSQYQHPQAVQQNSYQPSQVPNLQGQYQNPQAGNQQGPYHAPTQQNQHQTPQNQYQNPQGVLQASQPQTQYQQGQPYQTAPAASGQGQQHQNQNPMAGSQNIPSQSGLAFPKGQYQQPSQPPSFQQGQQTQYGTSPQVPTQQSQSQTPQAVNPASQNQSSQSQFQSSNQGHQTHQHYQGQFPGQSQGNQVGPAQSATSQYPGQPRGSQTAPAGAPQYPGQMQGNQAAPVQAGNQYSGQAQAGQAQPANSQYAGQFPGPPQPTQTSQTGIHQFAMSQGNQPGPTNAGTPQYPGQAQISQPGQAVTHPFSGHPQGSQAGPAQPTTPYYPGQPQPNQVVQAGAHQFSGQVPATQAPQIQPAAQQPAPSPSMYPTQPSQHPILPTHPVEGSPRLQAQKLPSPQLQPQHLAPAQAVPPVAQPEPSEVLDTEMEADDSKPQEPVQMEEVQPEPQAAPQPEMDPAILQQQQEEVEQLRLHMVKLLHEGAGSDNAALQVLNVFDTMRRLRPDLKPNVEMYTALLAACGGEFGNAPIPDRGIEVYQEMMSQGCQINMTSYPGLVTILSLKDVPDQARSWLEEMRQNGVVPSAQVFSVLISSFSRAGDISSCMELYVESRQAGVHLSEDDYSTVLMLSLQSPNAGQFEELINGMAHSLKRTKKGVWGLLRRYYAGLGTFKSAEAKLQGPPTRPCSNCKKPLGFPLVSSQTLQHLLQEANQAMLAQGAPPDTVQALENWFQERTAGMEPKKDEEYICKNFASNKACPAQAEGKCWFAHEDPKEKWFDAVLDGESIAGSSTGVDFFEKVDMVLRSLQDEGKQAVIVLSVSQLQVNSCPAGQEILTRWASDDIISYCPAGVKPVLYWLCACFLNGGSKLMGVSNSEFSEPEQFLQSPEFAQWKDRHQVRLSFVSSEAGGEEQKALLEPLKDFKHCIQSHGDGSWHFPDSESDSWLCVVRTSD